MIIGIRQVSGLWIMEVLLEAHYRLTIALQDDSEYLTRLVFSWASKDEMAMNASRQNRRQRSRPDGRSNSLLIKRWLIDIDSLGPLLFFAPCLIAVSLSARYNLEECRPTQFYARLAFTFGRRARKSEVILLERKKPAQRVVLSRNCCCLCLLQVNDVAATVEVVVLAPAPPPPLLCVTQKPNWQFRVQDQAL